MTKKLSSLGDYGNSLYLCVSKHRYGEARIGDGIGVFKCLFAGGIKKVQRFEDDAALNDIVRGLRVIERKIKAAVRKSGMDIENFEEIKNIVDNIEI